MSCPPLRVLDLFSGIGGFALGLERAGMETVAFCELEPYARRVLRRHWPTVPLFEDVRTLTARRLRKEGIEADVVCGGFPCQDISTAGKGAGIEGRRSGLWKEMFRLVREVRPAWVIAENVPALRTRGADVVLADLEGAGYAAWPLVVGAHQVGAPHRRERVWIVAHSEGNRAQWRAGVSGPDSMPAQFRPDHVRGSLSDGYGPVVADASGPGRAAWRADRMGEGPSQAGPPAQRGWWQVEPGIRRVVDGVPARLDRLRCLGNAVVPQVVELIGRVVVAHHEALHATAPPRSHERH